MDALFIFSGGLYESFCATQFKKNREKTRKTLGKKHHCCGGDLPIGPGIWGAHCGGDYWPDVNVLQSGQLWQMIRQQDAMTGKSISFVSHFGPCSAHVWATNFGLEILSSLVLVEWVKNLTVYHTIFSGSQNCGYQDPGQGTHWRMDCSTVLGRICAEHWKMEIGTIPHVRPLLWASIWTFWEKDHEGYFTKKQHISLQSACFRMVPRFWNENQHVTSENNRFCTTTSCWLRFDFRPLFHRKKIALTTIFAYPNIFAVCLRRAWNNVRFILLNLTIWQHTRAHLGPDILWSWKEHETNCATTVLLCIECWQFCPHILVPGVLSNFHQFSILFAY